jgi:hypothetical protein
VGAPGSPCSLAGRLVISRCSGSAGRAVETSTGSWGLDTAGAAGAPPAVAPSATAGDGPATAGSGFLAPGSLGDTSRRSPSRSALRRTRSAWASSMLDEWLLTPIPSASQRSSVSLLVSPSSRPSSYTRILCANCRFRPFPACAGTFPLLAALRRPCFPAALPPTVLLWRLSADCLVWRLSADCSHWRLSADWLLRRLWADLSPLSSHARTGWSSGRPPRRP